MDFPDLNRTAFVINPKAKNGKALAVWQGLLSRHQELRACSFVTPARGENLKAWLSSATAQGIDRIIAVGGDGTVHWLVNEVMALGLQDALIVGIIPAGTGSDFVRSINIPKRPPAALKIALEGAPRNIDLIRIRQPHKTPQFAVNIASVGLSGQIVKNVNDMANRNRFTYLKKAIANLAIYRPLPCRIVTAGGLWFEGNIYLLAIANGRYFGKGMKIAPEAAIDDGLLDLVLVTDATKGQIILRLPLLYAGRHLDCPMVRCQRTSSVNLQPLARSPSSELDGEASGSGSIEAIVLPKALRVMVPR